MTQAKEKMKDPATQINQHRRFTIMTKSTYQKELLISGSQKRKGASPNKKDILKIQSWLTLNEMANPGVGTLTGIDGDFGPATDQAVRNFQRAIKVAQTGVVDQSLFSKLCAPLQNAFEGSITGSGLRQMVVNVAKNHLQNYPFELIINNQSNSGPWVRSYMDGHEGESWYWCMGFVQSVIDQAASLLGKDFRTLMPLTFSCDTVGTTGLQKGTLFRYTDVRNTRSQVKPGDIFLLQKTPNDWVHTGIIVSIGTETFETIEGNTNEGGSSNGNGVYRRIRNFMTSKLDVFSIQPLV
jgi:peptidoglycan hydrolase-like protein with peptidoglycan-binding domain